MQKQILSELQCLRMILAHIAGTSDLSTDQQFSTAALDEAAKSFQKMKIERGEWVKEDEIGKFIKGTCWRAGAFIRIEFRFTAFFKRGRSYYYQKSALIELGKELKERNVDLDRYMDLKQSQAEFKRKIASFDDGKKKGARKPNYHLPVDLKNITTSPPPYPEVDLVKENLRLLQEEFIQYKLGEYLNIYNGNYAMLKYIYPVKKYMDPMLRKRSAKWCENFNYANHALELISGKKAKFDPVPESEMIEL